jgi:predicted secreted hydrolase
VEHHYLLAFFRSWFGFELSRFAHFFLHTPGAGGVACERSLSPFGTRARIEPGRIGIDYDGWRAAFDGDELALRADHEGRTIDLRLAPCPPIVCGEEGVIDIGTIRTACYSMPRLATVGEVRLGDRIHEVNGLSWCDHEWGAIPLPHRWDWWGLNLEDGSDLVVRHARGRGVANLRRADGRVETTSRILAEPTRTWQPPGGSAYPVAWQIALPELNTNLVIQSERDACETPFHVRYWEGACRVDARLDGASLRGTGYMELVGYNNNTVSFVTSRLGRLLGDLVHRDRRTDLGSTF